MAQTIEERVAFLEENLKTATFNIKEIVGLIETSTKQIKGMLEIMANIVEKVYGKKGIDGSNN